MPCAIYGERPMWVSTGEAARRLGISRYYLYGRIQRGELPAYRAGRYIRIDPVRGPRTPPARRRDRGPADVRTVTRRERPEGRSRG